VSHRSAITPKVFSLITAIPATDNQHAAAADQMDKPTLEAPTPSPLRDLVRTLQVGGCFGARIGHRRMTVEVKLIASKGEYASWRASRATASKPGRAEAESGIPAGHQASPSFARSPVEIAAHAGPRPRHMVDGLGVDRGRSQVDIAANGAGCRAIASRPS
jgi:hypothetical protein